MAGWFNALLRILRSSFAAVFYILLVNHLVRTVAAKSAPVVDITSRSGGVFTSQTKQYDTIKQKEGERKERNDKNSELKIAKP